MVQKWNTTSYAEAAVSEAWSVVATKLINGTNTGITRYAGTSDPSGGGTWGADQIGAVWYDRTNELGAGGDDLGSETKFWEKTGATPTYGWKQKGLRGYFAVSPITNALAIGATNATWTDLDLTSYTSDRALAAKIMVEVQDSNPAAGVFGEFRKNGVTTDALTIRAYPQAGGITIQHVFDIELDSGQILEYALRTSAATAGNLRVDVLGYYERA